MRGGGTCLNAPQAEQRHERSERRTIISENDAFRFYCERCRLSRGAEDEIKKTAFTLAEVLITLGIIGVVAAMTLPALITNIHNKGYAERLIKLYSALGQANISISQDIGEDPENWTFSHYANTDGNADNLNILSLYQRHLKAVKVCAPRECLQSKEKYSYLNGLQATNLFYTNSYELYTIANIIMLADGSTVGVLFAQNNAGGMFWVLYSLGYKILYIIDVNGEQKPNKLGRDIFFLALDGKTGKIIPYNMEDMSDCSTSGKGESCAAKIISEGKMNY